MEDNQQKDTSDNTIPINEAENKNAVNDEQEEAEQVTGTSGGHISEESQTEENATPRPEEQIDKLKQELQESKDKQLRLYAEFENFRRRNNKERADLIKSANQDLLKDLISVLDDFERANQSIEKAQSEGKEEEVKEIKALQEGMQLVYDKFKKTLEHKGLKAMGSTIGKAFDAETQEAITQVPAPSEDMKGKVIDEIEKGYYLNDKILRFAKVVVGS